VEDEKADLESQVGRGAGAGVSPVLLLEHGFCRQDRAETRLCLRRAMPMPMPMSARSRPSCDRSSKS
jgi:hypothetical protein